MPRGRTPPTRGRARWPRALTRRHRARPTWPPGRPTWPRALNDQVLPVLDLVIERLPEIQESARTISAEAAALAEAVAGATESLDNDLAALAQDMDELAEKYPELADDPVYQQMRERVDTAAARADDIAEKAQAIADTADRIDQVIQDSEDLTPRVEQARDDLVRLDEGATQVASGAHDLDDGLATLATGAHDLQDGLGDLDAGSSELFEGLRDGAGRLPVLTQDQQDQAAQVLSSPADVRMDVDHPATYYGRGLAPMFFAIALWVFGISVFLVVRPVAGRLLTGRANPLRLSLTAWYPVAVIAVLGELIMVGVVWAFLGLDPVRPLSLLGLTVLGALCFSSIAHLLRTALGTVASAITLVWLVLQLPTSGGTYPAELLPSVFSALTPFMPMTYLIDGFRVVISGGQTERLVTDVLVLAVITVISMTLCTLVIRRKQQFAMKDLHPPLVAP